MNQETRNREIMSRWKRAKIAQFADGYATNKDRRIAAGVGL